MEKIIFAHRGSSYEAPENTVAAFKLAKKHSADGFEFDVRLSKDGHVVVIHDYHFRRFKTKGKVKKLTLSQIKNINVGNTNYPFEKVPTLEEVLELWKNNETPKYMKIELKTSKIFNKALELKTLEILNTFNNQNPSLNLFKYVFIISFNPFSLKMFKKFAPLITRGLLIRRSPRRLKSKIATWVKNLADPDIIILNKRKIDERLLATYSNKYKFGAYTVNTAEEFEKLKNLNLTYIITDNPLICKDEA